MSRRARPLLRRHARLAARVAACAMSVLAAFVILVGVVRGGTRFFYCPMTHLAFDAPPCAQGHDEADDDDGPAVRTADCCQEKWRAAAPTARVPAVETGEVAPASVVAMHPAPPRGMEIVSARVPFEIAHAVRAGPPPLTAAERRAELMVWRN